MKRCLVFLFIFLIIFPFTCGCWNRREPEALAIVLGIGFDYEKDKGMYKATAQIANPLALGGSDVEGSNGGNKKTFLTLSAPGELPYRSMRNLTNMATREFFWAHNRIVLLTENLARHGIHPVTDMFGRNRQLRTFANVAVVDGDLEALLNAEFPLEETGAMGLDRQIETIKKERAIFPTNSINELNNVLVQPGKDVFIGRIKVLEGAEDDNDDPPSLIEGGAMFRGDKMVGWAEEEHTRGWAYVTCKTLRSTLTIEDPIDNRTPINIDITGIKSKMELIKAEPGEIRIEVKIYAEGRIQDIPVHRDLDTESDYTKSLEKRTAQEIRNTIQSSIDLSRELNSDIIGFGNLIYRKKPKLWTDIEDRWYEILRDIDIDINVYMNINRTGFATSPMKMEE